MSVIHHLLRNGKRDEADVLVRRSHRTVTKAEVEDGAPGLKTRMLARVLNIKKAGGAAKTAVVCRPVGGGAAGPSGRFARVEVSYFRMLYLGTSGNEVLFLNIVP